MALLLLTAPSYGHVAMSFKAGQIGPIRNANGATGNGRASVAGPCSGAGTFGANGIGSATDGETVTLNINYAAGHASAQNAFRMAFACGAPNENTMGGAGAVLTAADNGCTGTVAGAPATYNDNGVDGGIPAPNAIVDGGYDITCTLPLQNNAAPLECTVALIDQRDWGGCVDITLNAAGVPEPPSPPPAPIIPNAASYRMLATNSIDTSAADFTCCPLAEGAPRNSRRAIIRRNSLTPVLLCRRARDPRRRPGRAADHGRAQERQGERLPHVGAHDGAGDG